MQQSLHHLQHPVDMVCLHQQNIPNEYQSFLIKNQVADNVELYFKSAIAPFRGISLIRSVHQGAFSARDLLIIESCFNLAKFNFSANIENSSSASIFHASVFSDQLTQKEQQVIEYVLQGKKNQEIANALFVSLATVKTHIQHIFQKTMVNSRQELILKSRS